MAEGGALREVAARFGIEFDGKKLEEGNKLIEQGIGIVKKLGAAFAANEIVRGIGEFARSFAESAREVKDASQRLGIGTEELQSLQHAGRLAGVQADELNASLQKLLIGIGQGGASPASQALRQLGVAARDASGHTRSASEIMDDVATAMGHIDDPARRSATAVALFGRAGARLIPLLHGGEDGLAAMRAEFAELGGGINEDGIRAGEEFGRSLNRWQVASEGVRTVIATQLLPKLAAMVMWVTRAVAAFVKWQRGTEVVRLAMITLTAVVVAAGVAMLVAWAPVLIPIAAVAAILTGMVLIVDDIITLFRGGDSVIGRLMDKLFGVGASVRFVKAVRAEWAHFLGTLHNIEPVLRGALNMAVTFGRGFVDAFTWVANAIDFVFTHVFGMVSGRINALITGISTLAGLVPGLGPIVTAMRGINDTFGVSNAVGRVTTQTTMRAGTGVADTRGMSKVISVSAPITIHGATDARAVGRQVQQHIHRAARAERDADHPLAPRDE